MGGRNEENKATIQKLRPQQPAGRLTRNNTDLRGWIRPQPGKSYPAGGKRIPGLESVSSGNPLNATFMLGGVARVVSEHLSDDTYLRGNSQGAGSIVTAGRTYVEIETQASTVLDDENFTVSTWLSFDDEVIVAERDANLVQVESGTYRYEVQYDKDGGGGAPVHPSINITVTEANDPATVISFATFRIPTSVLPFRRWTGWHQLSVVFASAIAGKAAVKPNAWTVIVDDEKLVMGGSPTVGTPDPPTDVEKVIVGGPDPETSAKGRPTKYGEIAFWSVPRLPSLALSVIYDAATSAYGTGMLSLGPRAQICATACERDAYPTIAKSTDQYRLNRTTPYFNDDDTIIYENITGTPVNYAIGLISGSTGAARAVSTPNTVPSIYVGGAKASAATITALSATGTDYIDKILVLTDALGKAVRFEGENTTTGPVRKEMDYYTIGFKSIADTDTAAARIKSAIVLANTEGDIRIAQSIDASVITLTQKFAGTSGNTKITGDMTTIGPMIGVVHFTGGTGTTGVVTVSSFVVGGYPTDSPKSFASSYVPFNDAREPVDIAARPAYLPLFAPGFTPKTGDRVMIEIDITPSQEHRVQVITGSDGQTYNPGENIRSQEENTGLSYFQFFR